MLGVRNSLRNSILFALPSKYTDLRIRGRVILTLWEEEDWQNPIYKPMLSAWCYSLYPCLFFFFSLCLCSVCVIALFLYFRLSLFFFFSCVLPLFIEKLQRSFSLIFLSTDQIMEQFSSVFPPHFLIPCWAMTHYSAFCSFYLFRCFLNSLFLVCDIPTFPLFGPSFMKPCSLLSSVATSHLLFFFFF